MTLPCCALPALTLSIGGYRLWNELAQSMMAIPEQRDRRFRGIVTGHSG